MAPIFSTLQFAAYAYLLQYAGGVSAAAIDSRSLLSTLEPYAPLPASCPSTPLVRAATSVGSSEATYVTKRKAKADVALAAWLKKTNSKFSTTSLPSIGLTSSGGGVRALLCGAGVVQGFDSRDSNVSTSGLYQALTYHVGLSGGSWFLSSLAGNNWPTVTSLKTSLWETAFEDSLLVPENILVAAAYSTIVNDILQKSAAGYEPTLVDVWGRLLSYQLLDGNDGGVATRLSTVTSYSNFTSYAVPYPIITARGVDAQDGQCIPAVNALQYEFGPYEMGSWDSGVKAFTQTKYLGSSLSNGASTTGYCTVDYDNLGYILGTSSTLFNEACSIIPAINSTTVLSETLEAIVARDHTPIERDLFAVYPNPFHKYTGSPSVSNQTELDLVDGGEAGQNNPIWPLIQPSRNLSVIIVDDNSADTTDNFPNGTEILTTYQQAQAAGLTRMPYIPSVSTFVSEGLNKRATFFGCNEPNAITIVWLPNVNYTYASNTPTLQLQYSKAETDGIIANGINVADQNGDSQWATCLGCAIMKKTGTTLPTACTACFTKYCYTQ
ncbi:hypothetical protein MBLNU459_g7484t1 [Dothideomycetes sp. NU459]